MLYGMKNLFLFDTSNKGQRVYRSK